LFESFNFLFLSLLVRSGLEILSAHPRRFYWNDHCTPGSEWLKFTKKRRPADRLWTASDEETSFPPLLALPGRENLGLGRHWHFIADFAWLLTGLVYIAMLWTSAEWRRLIPASWQIIPDAGRALLGYLTLHIVEAPGRYNGLQQLSYAAVVFLLAPFSIATGIAMSPAVAARFPWYIKDISRTAGRAEPAFPGSLHVPPVLHRSRRPRGPARFPQRTGDDCPGGDSQSAFDARAGRTAG
jgi:methionine sulfoxide reductase catalytic subunit